MRIDLMTLFPQLCETFLSESIIGRARRSEKIFVKCHQIRNFALDKHSAVDDTIYGHGKGMLLKAEPLALCFEAICDEVGERPHLVYMSPQGSVLTQQKAVELSRQKNLTILCGRYEGVDERFIETFVDEQISIGDFVLTGGEIPGIILADAVSRMVSGVLTHEECFQKESHYNGMLEYPQYTKPALWRGKEVPEVLLSGDHAKILQWENEKSFERTEKMRPDLLKNKM